MRSPTSRSGSMSIQSGSPCAGGATMAAPRRKANSQAAGVDPWRGRQAQPMMRINADFTKRACVHAATSDWVQSPMPGVERRMLDRVGDEGGDYPAGSYVRNPPTSRHTPGSQAGCTIFVKLFQFDPADRSHVNIDTRLVDAVTPAGRRGVRLIPLFNDGREDVRIEQWQADASVVLGAPGGFEALVLAGSFEEGGETFARHSWLRLPKASRLTAVAGAAGARLWIKTGHLQHVLAHA